MLKLPVTLALAFLVQTAALADPPSPEAIGVIFEPAEHQGRSALRVELSDEEQAAQLAGAGGNRPTFALFDFPFANGVIEVDVAAEINGRGGRDARGFAGIAFHVSADGEQFEAVYLRMANGTANDPLPPSPRNARAVQYVAHPGFHFADSRALRPDHYEQPANVALGTWHRLRLHIRGSALQAFVDDALVLSIDDLRQPDVTGPIGLWVGDGSRAHFANLTISDEAALPIVNE
ncbi:family 16 glycoside hydrolase [Qipengyuania sp. ASV99]|uniref:family 16 glycoside hydrolase n=1 Tax=Qipengyuania sp. ASV99 TaxID=3399681 RepID=UPI003A4C7042